MRTFDSFLAACKDEINHHQQTLKRSFEQGWLPLLKHYRTHRRLPEKPNTNHIVLKGLFEYNLTDEEAFFILAHTGSYSSWINQPLRDGNAFDSVCKEEFATRLDNSLDKLPPFADKNVFRMDSPSGIKVEVCSWFKENIGSIVNVPYFLSTSKENWESTEVTWDIQTMKSNSKARDVCLITNNDTEKEVLFKRNSTFMILSVNEDSGTIQLKEVDSFVSAINLTGSYFTRK